LGEVLLQLVEDPGFSVAAPHFASAGVHYFAAEAEFQQAAWLQVEAHFLEVHLRVEVPVLLLPVRCSALLIFLAQLVFRFHLYPFLLLRSSLILQIITNVQIKT